MAVIACSKFTRICVLVANPGQLHSEDTQRREWSIRCLEETCLHRPQRSVTICPGVTKDKINAGSRLGDHGVIVHCAQSDVQLRWM